MICYKCNVDKPLDQYYVEQRWGKEYRKKYCTDCFRAQSREWKKLNRKKKSLEPIVEPVIEIIEEHIQEERSPEITPLESQIGPTRLCQTCELEKPITEYYIKYKTKCKRCVLDHNKKRELEEGSGTRWMVHRDCNKYYCEEQRNELFDLMVRLGWTFSTEKQVWWRAGFKDENKNFYFGDKVILHKEKKKGMVRHIPPRRFSDKEIEDILHKRSMGMKYNEIADIYNSSHTTLRKWVVNYYEKKKDEKRTN